MSSEKIECPDCGSVHGQSFGEVRDCLRRRAEAWDASWLVDQVDALTRDMAERRNEGLGFR